MANHIFSNLINPYSLTNEQLLSILININQMSDPSIFGETDQRTLWEVFHFFRSSNEQTLVMKINKSKPSIINFIEGKKTKILNLDEVYFPQDVPISPKKSLELNWLSLLNISLDSLWNLINLYANQNGIRFRTLMITYSLKTFDLTFTTPTKGHMLRNPMNCGKFELELKKKRNQRLMLIAIYDPNSFFYKDKFPLDISKLIYKEL